MTSIEDLENRFTYHPPNGDEDIRIYQEIRAAGLQFTLLLIQHAVESRELSLAITNVEQAVMWANASIARHGRNQ